MLLIMAVGAPMLDWHDEFHVAGLDNRNSGLATHLSTAGVPSLVRHGP